MAPRIRLVPLLHVTTNPDCTVTVNNTRNTTVDTSKPAGIHRWVDSSTIRNRFHKVHILQLFIVMIG